MNEKCYINQQYLKKRRKADGIYAKMDRAYCGFQKSVPGTVFGTRPKGV